MYRVKVERRATKELERLPENDGDRVALAIRGLVVNPRPPGCVRLTGTRRRLYRIRVGVYRVLYEIKDDMLLVLVVRVSKRDQAYRDL